MQEESIDDVVERMVAGHEQSRRGVLRRLGGMGGAPSRAGALVAGCGGVKGTQGGAAKQEKRAATISHPKEAIADWTWSNWPLYMDKKLLKQFDKRYGGHVKYIEDINDNAEFTGKVQDQLQAGKPNRRGPLGITHTTAAQWVPHRRAGPGGWGQGPHPQKTPPPGEP